MRSVEDENGFAAACVLKSVLKCTLDILPSNPIADVHIIF